MPPKVGDEGGFLVMPNEAIRPGFPLCAKCHSVIRGQPVFLFSVIDGRNYGPFHVSCSETMDEADDLRVRQVQYPERYAAMDYETFRGRYWEQGR